jgi:AraC-like DNA-binding protein
MLQQLTAAARAPVPPPSWWTADVGFCGGVETWRYPTSYYFDGTDRPGPNGEPVACVQIVLAGWGHFQAQGQEPQKIAAGKAFLVTNPAQHRYYLPDGSPGWTFAWAAIHHPYVRDRVAKQVTATGPLFDVSPDGALTASVVRLVRGAIKKDFSDQFEAEKALFEFVLSYERSSRQPGESKSASEAQRLKDQVRSCIVARLPRAMGVSSIAAEFGMSRSHFSQVFRERTGLTPARFVTEVRIQNAARLLLDTRAPLKAIADVCGFANASHFSKVFRRIRHMTPVSFREGWR